MDVHSIVSNHMRTNEPTQKTFRQRQRNFSIPKILLFSALYNQIELLLFHRFLSAGNWTLGENKFNPSARLDAPHSEALFFNYRSVLLCPGEGGDVWHAAGSQQLQPAALEPIQQQLVSSLQLAPKFKRRPVLQMQSGGRGSSCWERKADEVKISKGDAVFPGFWQYQHHYEIQDSIRKLVTPNCEVANNWKDAWHQRPCEVFLCLDSLL